jgi:hypothetical protein
MAPSLSFIKNGTYTYQYSMDQIQQKSWHHIRCQLVMLSRFVSTI